MQLPGSTNSLSRRLAFGAWLPERDYPRVESQRSGGYGPSASTGELSVSLKTVRTICKTSSTEPTPHREADLVHQFALSPSRQSEPR
jgi:hypothetical protein